MMLQANFCKTIILAALLTGAAGTALAWETCGTNLEYELDGATIRFRSADPTAEATIQTEAFKDNTTITSVTLPENVSQIGSQAFMGCTKLATVELSNVQDISSYAFKGCTSLTEVVIPPTVTNIGGYAFYGCTALHDVLCRRYTAPSLGTDAFTKCNPLAESGCYNDLEICVPALGNYRYEDNWKVYYNNTVLGECAFLDESDEEANTNTKINAYRGNPEAEIPAATSVTLFRTLRKAGSLNTLTLPFNVPNLAASPLGGDNVEVYTFTDAAVVNGTLIFDIAKVTANRLSAGVPYLIQWDNTGEVMTRMDFTDIDGWDDNNTAETTSGTGVTFHGFYGKTHINDATSGTTHLNLFLQANNQLYWPSDGEDEDAKMLGFRAWFRITGSSVAGAPVRRGMPASLRIVSTPTGVEQTNLYGTADRKKSEIRNQKLIEDGRLIIIRNGEKYSINGQKL